MVKPYNNLEINIVTDLQVFIYMCVCAYVQLKLKCYNIYYAADCSLFFEIQLLLILLVHFTDNSFTWESFWMPDFNMVVLSPSLK